MLKGTDPNVMNQSSTLWSQNYLSKNGYTIKGLPELIRAMPWSRVTRFSTSKGFIYLKEMASLFSLEPILIKTLAKWDGGSIPSVIAINNATMI